MSVELADLAEPGTVRGGTAPASRVRWPELESGPGEAVAAPGLTAAGLPQEIEFIPVVDAESWHRVLSGESLEDEIERARQEGYREGFHRGRAEGSEETLRQVRSSKDLLLRAAEELRARQAGLLASLEEEMVRLSLALAARVVGEAAGQNRELVLLTVREALRRAEGESAITVRVHPADLECVRSNRESFRDALDGIEKIEFLADRRVGPGGCMIDTASSRIDARVDMQVNELVEAILAHLEEKHDTTRLDGAAPEDA